MDTEKQRSFIIHFLYYSLLILTIFVFFRYIIYAIMPFLIGFIIAFLLRPLIVKLSKHGHERFFSLVVILLFYMILALTLSWLLMKGFFYIRQWMTTLPQLYEQYMEPYLHTSLVSTQNTWKNIDGNTAQIFTAIAQSLQNSLSSFIMNISKSILNSLTSIMTSIPKIAVSFFFAILSSFFFNSDYTNMLKFLKRILPIKVQSTLLETQQFLRTTCWQLSIAYCKLMAITFVQLCVGLYVLGVDHILWIAIGTTLFDIVPILGTGGIMIPWSIIMYLNNQPKLALGLIILQLIIALTRNILEPKIIGKQLGLHPLIMLICMYLGIKLFGVLGLITLPLLVLILTNKNRLQPF
ncbi:MAG: sporulation integral membrane protein YtvI [Longicatena sp.]